MKARHVHLSSSCVDTYLEAAEYYPANYKRCPEHIRHKDYMFDIERLQTDGIRVNCIAQSPGDFIITHPRGYHQGINLGDNINEAVNFCTINWIEYGRGAGVCLCGAIPGVLQFNTEDMIDDIRRMLKEQSRSESESELSSGESATDAKRSESELSSAESAPDAKRIRR